MVHLTVELIAKSRKHFKKKRGLSLPEYLKTLTHLHLSSKNIEGIGDISICSNLSVLYLYDNQITYICNLGFASNLTHLYMQKNNITHIDNLDNLPKLSKLYLSGNKIAVVEGLDQLRELKELHLENQRLAPGEKLLFDSRTLLSLAESLCVLNINRNNIDDIRDLSVLKELRHLSAADNKLHRIEELEDVLGLWPRLIRVDLSGNPVCKRSKYRDHLITVCKSIETLDGREINELTRQFIINWKASKEAKKKRHKRRVLLEPLITVPLSNDFNTGQGPHPGHIYSPYYTQKWKQQPSLRTPKWKIPMSGPCHSTMSSLICSQMNA
ncbi:protein phosphatase 1 regulatory subunit 42 [Leuresthes tenuis]|uniref:protein phosphatase 1 regulatory subunit 42 n=1 Tax=Leuresthes tenuis TaxID=355514 RepID=UPI003B50551D